MIDDESPRICVGCGIQTFQAEKRTGDWPGQVGGAKSHHHSEKNFNLDQVEQKKKKKETFCVKRKVVGPRALGGYYTSSHITYTGEVKVKEEQLILIKAGRYRAK